MFVIINITCTLLQTLSSFFTTNQKYYATKNEKKSSHRKYHHVTSIKIDIIEKYYYIREREFNRKQQ